MEPEVIVWLSVSVIGLLALPFVSMRRGQEWGYYQAMPGHLRRLLLLSRVSRTVILSIGILMSSGVAVVVSIIPPSDDRRTVSVIMLTVVNMSIVGAMWSDEYWARRIDRYTPKGNG